jgi:hypothetical protein
MKKVLLVVMSLVILASCKKDKDNDPSPAVNYGNVTPEAVGKWLHGTFSMTEFWGYDGSYHGNAFSQSVAFTFNADGTYEMFYTGQTNYYGCTQDGFSNFKGYVVFTDSSFTVHPQSGRFRGYYNCLSYSNFDRPAAANELKVQTYYYNYETDTNNKKWMVVRFDPADQYPSYFEETSW